MIRFPRAEIRDLIRELTELPVGNVVWDVERLPFVGVQNGKPGYWVELSVNSTRTKGVDDYRQSFDSVKLRLNTLIYAYRLFRLEIKVGSNDIETAAFDVTELIRRRLRTVTAKAELHAANLALVKFYPTIDLPKAADNRTLSSSVLDLDVAWMVAEDPLDDSGNWVETVNSGGIVPADPPIPGAPENS